MLTIVGAVICAVLLFTVPLPLILGVIGFWIGGGIGAFIGAVIGFIWQSNL